MTKTLLLIDADYPAYATASAVQVGIPWDDDIFTSHADLNEAKRVFDNTVRGYLEATEADDAILCFSCPSRRYFRHDVEATYKGNRKGSPSPLVYRDLRTWAASEYPSRVYANLEADDCIGILATITAIRGFEKWNRVVVSADKDMRQIPGLHWNPMKPLDGITAVTKAEAERFLWLQVLTGDSVDGYPGLPGTGPVRAERILDKANGDYATAVAEAYAKAGFDDEYLAKQINLARILTAASYNFLKKEPILWTP